MQLKIILNIPAYRSIWSIGYILTDTAKIDRLIERERERERER